MRQMNSSGAEMIPIRLVISIVIIAAIVGLIAVGSDNLRIYLAEHQIEQQCCLLQSTLSTMVASGVSRDINEINAADGTKRVQMFVLPDSLLYLSFGGDPDPSNTGTLSSGLFHDGSVIVYRVDGGSKQVLWFPEKTFSFRGGEFIDNKWVLKGTEESYVISCGGKTTLVFECVQQNHGEYILVYGVDGG